MRPRRPRPMLCFNCQNGTERSGRILDRAKSKRSAFRETRLRQSSKQIYWNGDEGVPTLTDPQGLHHLATLWVSTTQRVWQDGSAQGLHAGALLKRMLA